MRGFVKAVQIILVIVGAITCIVFGGKTYSYYRDVQDVVVYSDGNQGYYVDAQITSKIGNIISLHADRHEPSEYSVVSKYSENYNVGDTVRVILNNNKQGVALRPDWDLDMHYMFKNGLVAIAGLAALLLCGSFLILDIVDRDTEDDYYDSEEQIMADSSNIEETLQKELSNHVKELTNDDN